MVAVAGSLSVCAQDQPSEATIPTDADKAAHLDIYGFAMLDTGYDFKQNDPNWFDVVRPTKLPSW